MKKCLIILLSVFFINGIVFSQDNNLSSANSANKNTALRCLKLAENCLVGKDWNNAIKQADLGLTYDDSISDLEYIKAAAQINLGETKNAVLKLVESAFAKDNWVGYKKSGARILYADLLSDTGLYEQSMSVLDSEPLIYSADAEFIRIKNLYRTGTEESINNARLKLNSARRIYPSDARFPNIFFMFEFMYMNRTEISGQQYILPEIVNTIASYYIAKLPDYSGDNTELELLAAFFAGEDVQKRLVKAIDAKEQTESPVLALAGLKTGLYSDKQAYDLFISSSDNNFYLPLLQALILQLKDVDVKHEIMEKLLNFTGSIYIDNNLDLQNELVVEYSTGRPQYINYDQNDDGVIDVSVTCDFGVPLLVHFEKNNSEVFYDKYPGVSKISFVEEKYDFNFLSNEYYFVPFNLEPDSVISCLGLDFYVPEMVDEIMIPSINDIVMKSASVELPVTERDGAIVKYTTLDGKLVYADFYENGKEYATCDFGDEMPLIRYVDYDNDSYFETIETYDIAEENQKDLYDKAAVEGIFGKVIGDEQLYLKKVSIDRNGNTFSEFSEQYLENGGKITLWDNDDNGVWDCQHIKYPQDEELNQLEETIFFDTNGLPLISLSVIDGIPVKMVYKNSEVMIYAGKTDGLYWIDEEGTEEMEDEVLNSIKTDLQQGVIQLVVYKEQRISVIKVDKNIYCKLLPESDIEIEEDSAENPENEVAE